ncbi:MAG: helix-turn-helix domain-containing protein [Clostridia bacterium]|nr:helix-turn-helix domain-containing protein [Clostridia bacterium]
MEFAELDRLIRIIECGTRLHVGVVFLNDFGNFKMALPFERTIHSKPYCEYMKSKPLGYKRCFACRTRALNKAIGERRAFGGKCINGVYEYLYPVIIRDEVCAVIFVGNILTEDVSVLGETLEPSVTEEQCREIAELIDVHIKLLDKMYSGVENGYHPLVANITSYIEDSLGCDITVSQLARAFNYSEKYIGQLFKAHTGMSVREYVNSKRLDRAESLLYGTSLSVTEIALRTGFNNVTYFNRLFKARHGVSPREYRNSGRN